MINKEFKIILIMGIFATAMLSLICFFIEPLCAIVCLVLGALLTIMFSVYTKRRYDNLNSLNDYLTFVCSGNYNLDIADNSEGELSILKNNLYKVISILRTQNELLEKDKIYLSDSLADISHQLKTPLTSMMVMSDLLRDEKSEDKREEFVSVIETQLDKMKWLITNLLKISKLDSGATTLNREENSSVGIIEEALSSFALLLELKQIKLENTAEDFLLIVDKAWTVEALQNIIKNCIEHTCHGGVLSISSESTNIYNMLRIRDNGCGIASEDLPHIFERFYHGRNSSDESVGIGLALAKTVFERENAEVSVQSTEGIGTEFTVKFYKGII